MVRLFLNIAYSCFSKGLKTRVLAFLTLGPQGASIVGNRPKLKKMENWRKIKLPAREVREVSGAQIFTGGLAPTRLNCDKRPCPFSNNMRA